MGSPDVNADKGATNPPRLPRRAYGRNGVELSVIGLGGIVLMGSEQDHANRVVAEAVERGVNYFDVAPTYGNGEAELRMGPALEPWRSSAFLACKTTERKAGPARAELLRSLERLRTDYFDLYQLHGIADVAKDVDVAFGAGGAMEVLIEARREGRVRHLGFSAHSVAAALAAMDRYDFDSILFPVSFVTCYRGDFGPRVLAAAKEKGIAVLALKAMARQKWPDGHPQRQTYRKCWYEPLREPREAALGLRFALGQGATAALPPGEEALFRLALDVAVNLAPITPAEERQLQEMAATLDPIFTGP